MGVSARELGRWTVVRLTGNMDCTTASSIGSVFSDLINSDLSCVLIDLTDVAKMDALVPAFLIGAYRRLHGKGDDFGMVDVSGRILTMLTEAGIAWPRARVRIDAPAEADMAH
jgi:anti-anti-sigma factor